MSDINADAPAVVFDPRRGPADGRPANGLAAPGKPTAIDEFIADVLHRAHATVAPLRDPDEARTILRVAHLFADHLAETDPRFNRLQFIHAITREPA
jgi:hypothetical protein